MRMRDIGLGGGQNQLPPLLGLSGASQALGLPWRDRWGTGSWICFGGEVGSLSSKSFPELPNFSHIVTSPNPVLGFSRQAN